MSEQKGKVVFLAWRELRFARGRFMLIATVVALITILVGFLSGLTGGLAAQNISSVLQLPGDHLVLQQPQKGVASFATSSIPDETIQAWKAAPGVEQVTPVGITQTHAHANGSDDPTGVALFGMQQTRHNNTPNPLNQLIPNTDNEVGVSASAAKKLGVNTGDTITITGHDYTIALVGSDLWYSHTPVIMMTEHAWSKASTQVGGTGKPTLLAIKGNTNFEAVAKHTSTVAHTPIASLSALEAFRSEVGSLGLMIVMLCGISALVVGAFFTVWTMQREKDLAVLKALGATTTSLLRDCLGQACVVLLAGITAGTITVVALGTLAGTVLPFVLHPLTTLLPATIMAVLGLTGAAFALRFVTKTNPLTALGSAR